MNMDFNKDLIFLWIKEYLENALSQYDESWLDGEITTTTYKKLRKAAKALSKGIQKDLLTFLERKISLEYKNWLINFLINNLS